MNDQLLWIKSVVKLRRYMYRIMLVTHRLSSNIMSSTAMNRWDLNTGYSRHFRDIATSANGLPNRYSFKEQVFGHKWSFVTKDTSKDGYKYTKISYD